MRKTSGWILLVVVGGMLILAGLLKVSGRLPEDRVAELGPLSNQLELIGLGAIASGVLLLTPRTAAIGILLSSSYWGGAICTHMLQETSYAQPAALLVMSWMGSILRDRRTLWSLPGVSEGGARSTITDQRHDAVRP
ncbi:MAG: hypothetical protein AAFU73_04245 [Planctomycetota bacterium]